MIIFNIDVLEKHEKTAVRILFWLVLVLILLQIYSVFNMQARQKISDADRLKSAKERDAILELDRSINASLTELIARHH